jgi:aspartate/methionine/tyrosine aminotransferase
MCDNENQQRRVRMRHKLNPQVLSFTQSGIRKFADEARTIPGIINFTIGEPEYDTPQAIKGAVIDAINHNQTHYPPQQGLLALREAISAFEAKTNGVTYNPQEIIITNGATEGLAAVLLAVLSEGDEVIIPSPMYVSYAPIIAFCKAKLVVLDTTTHDFQITPEALNACIGPKTKLILITSPNNPTGVVLTQASLDAVKAAALTHELFVLSDDVYHQLVFTSSFAKLIGDPQLRAQLIVTQSFSKPYAMTGWRVGYVLADEPITKAITLMHAYLVGGITTFNQHAAIEALKHNSAPMRDSYQHRRDLGLAKLTDMGLPCVKPEGAFYLFPDISEFGLDSETFCLRAMREAKLAMVPGRYFGADSNIRISYAVSEVELLMGMDRLKRFVEGLRKNAAV